MATVTFIHPDSISISISCTVEAGSKHDPVREVRLLSINKDGHRGLEGELKSCGGIWKSHDVVVVNFREKALVLEAVSASGEHSVDTPIIFECLPAAPEAPVIIY